MKTEYCRSTRIKLSGVINYGEFHRSFRTEIHENVKISKPHSHSCFEMELIEEGKGYININGTEYELSPGVVYFADPTDFHSIRSITPLRIITVLFKETVKVARDIYADTTRLLKLSDEDFSKAISLLNIIQSEQKNNQTDGVAENCFDALVNIIMRYLPMINAKENTLIRVLDFLRKNFNEDINEGDVAESVGLSSPHLSRNFKQMFGIGIKEYLTSLRISYSRWLIDTTDMSLLDIATESGFSTYSSFYRAFTATLKTSPCEYRKTKEQQERKEQDP